ncbi:hypothetical protein C7M84_010669 [Penaeus vannamei]|uniref:Uncharacterized protein n=1 Tax=Penaeus vannamei TaxID=6689 RepID=A0A423T3E6_PENVA|nr:hypothetical protein C7M84_010669 [Penaeus vannamei]
MREMVMREMMTMTRCPGERGREREGEHRRIITNPPPPPSPLSTCRHGAFLVSVSLKKVARAVLSPKTPLRNHLHYPGLFGLVMVSGWNGSVFPPIPALSEAIPVALLSPSHISPSHPLSLYSLPFDHSPLSPSPSLLLTPLSFSPSPPLSSPLSPSHPLIPLTSPLSPSPPPLPCDVEIACCLAPAVQSKGVDGGLYLPTQTRDDRSEAAGDYMLELLDRMSKYRLDDQRCSLPHTFNQHPQLTNVSEYEAELLNLLPSTYQCPVVSNLKGRCRALYSLSFCVASSTTRPDPTRRDTGLLRRRLSVGSGSLGKKRVLNAMRRAIKKEEIKNDGASSLTAPTYHSSILEAVLSEGCRQDTLLLQDTFASSPLRKVCHQHRRSINFIGDSPAWKLNWRASRTGPVSPLASSGPVCCAASFVSWVRISGLCERTFDTFLFLLVLLRSFISNSFNASRSSSFLSFQLVQRFSFFFVPFFPTRSTRILQNLRKKK